MIRGYSLERVGYYYMKKSYIKKRYIALILFIIGYFWYIITCTVYPSVEAVKDKYVRIENAQFIDKAKLNDEIRYFYQNGESIEVVLIKKPWYAFGRLTGYSRMYEYTFDNKPTTLYSTASTHNRRYRIYYGKVLDGFTVSIYYDDILLEKIENENYFVVSYEDELLKIGEYEKYNVVVEENK